MPFPTRLLVPGEELDLDLRPHPIALLLPALATIGIVIAWILGVKWWDGTINLVIFIAGVVLLLVYPVRHLLNWLTSHFVVTSTRVIHRQGLIAKRSIEIPLDKINDIRFDQGIFDRMVGAGDLTIRSASEDGPTTFEDVRHPEEVQKTIYGASERKQQNLFHPSSAPAAPGATPADPGRPAAPPLTPSTVTELERLADLRAKGVLTEAEFQAQKAKILGQ
ncbi:MAG: PH domain-containing protein [Actinomycetota bacterium]